MGVVKNMKLYNGKVKETVKVIPKKEVAKPVIVEAEKQKEILADFAGSEVKMEDVIKINDFKSISAETTIDEEIVNNYIKNIPEGNLVSDHVACKYIEATPDIMKYEPKVVEQKDTEYYKELDLEDVMKARVEKANKKANKNK